MSQRITLSDAMRMLGMHPHNKKRSEIKKQLTPLEPLKFGNAYAIYDKAEVESLMKKGAAA